MAAFSENLRTNTGLVRSILRSSDLVTEMIRIGERGKLNCALMYIDSIANTSLVNEVRRRLKGLDTDYISDSGNLVQFIDDHPQSLFPQTLSTERPDRVASHLAEGRLAIILEGSPFAQVLPASFFSFFHSGEDFSLKSGVANFMRILRFFGALLSTVLPSLYLSLSYFHPEAMPTELLLAIAGSRENVPFPAWFEVFVMEVSFELIREAGVRIPGILGSTIGIVGAIILGQAAVAAKLVSPIVVVLIAITGLASFTIPEYRMASAVRLIRFVLLAVGTTMGLVGLAMALLILATMLCGLKSYGVPYMAPIGPRTMANFDVVMRGQAFNQENRPDDLGTKDRRRQPTNQPDLEERPPAEGDRKRMNYQSGRMGVAEGLALSFIITFPTLFQSTPAFLAESAGDASWLVPLFGGLVERRPAGYPAFLLKRYAGDLLSVAETLLGKYGAYAVGLFFLLVLFSPPAPGPGSSPKIP